MQGKETKQSSQYQLSFTLPFSALEGFENALEDEDRALISSEIQEGDEKGLWQLDVIFEQKPEEEALKNTLIKTAQMLEIAVPQYTLEPLEQKDWLKENLNSFEPVCVGQYYIYGSHIQTPPPRRKLSLKIDAATAFGSGEHFTTKGCLMAMEELSKLYRPKRILDMGCGSGILALSAALTFKTNILACDIDEESVRVTKQNAKNNGLSRYVRAVSGNGYKPMIVRSRAPYDLVLSNILARPLTLMAKDLAAVLSPYGFGVLSGLLTTQESWVINAHKNVGLHLKKRYRLNGWSTLIVSKM